MKLSTHGPIRRFNRLEDVTLDDMKNNRVLCDVCATSIANLHISCTECSGDLCVACAISRQVSSSSPCPKCSAASSLQLRRLFDDQSISVMQRLAEDESLRGSADGIGRAAEDLAALLKLHPGWARPASASAAPPPVSSACEDVDGDMVFAWGHWVRKQDVRLARLLPSLQGRVDQVEQQLLFCPHSSSLHPDHPDFIG